MDANITILYRTAVNGVLVIDTVTVKKNSMYADSVAPEKMVTDIMDDGAWVVMDNGVKQYIPPHSIVNILVQEISDELSDGAPAPDAELQSGES